jgi:hypothetical protein
LNDGSANVEANFLLSCERPEPSVDQKLAQIIRRNLPENLPIETHNELRKNSTSVIFSVKNG